MLTSHTSLLEPRPSDRIRVGDRVVDRVVDLSLREIAPMDANGSPVRVRLKSIGVVAPTTGEGRCLGNGPVMPQGLSDDSVRRKLYASIPDEAGRDIGILPLRALGIATDALAQSD